MKQIGTQTQCAAAMEESEQTGSVNLGVTFVRWRQHRAQKDFKTDAELANLVRK